MNEIVASPELPNDPEMKRAFAQEYLKNQTTEHAFAVACSLFADDTGMALKASTRWPNDPEVKKYMTEAVEELGDLHFLPTKAELAREAYKMATDPKVPTDERLKAMRLYGDIRGFIDKQGININNTVLTTNKVMLVKDHGDDTQWEAKLAAQQSQLIEQAEASATARLN